MKLIKKLIRGWGQNYCQYCGELTAHDTIRCENCGRDHR